MGRVWALVPATQPWAGVAVPPAVGGVPDAVGELNWPACRVCAQPMRFLFQLPHLPGQLELAPGAALYAFQCENADSSCPRWDPNEGANAVFRLTPHSPGQLRGLRDARAYPRTLLALEAAEEDTAALCVDENEADDAALEALDAARESAPPSKLGGLPIWVQGPDVLQCCGAPMRFLAQLDSAAFGLELGDAGRAYVFECSVRCDADLKLLVQSA